VGGGIGVAGVVMDPVTISRICSASDLQFPNQHMMQTPLLAPRSMRQQRVAGASREGDGAAAAAAATGAHAGTVVVSGVVDEA